MTLLRNLALFFVLFLPASCATGLVGGFFVGPIEVTRLAYPVALYFSDVLPLLLPSLLAYSAVMSAGISVRNSSNISTLGGVTRLTVVC